MSLRMASDKTEPTINVTPLIDILLVLLIIFMIVTPLKPSRFMAFIPAPPQHEPIPPHPDPLTLVVTIQNDGNLDLNNFAGIGSVNDTGKLSAKLVDLFEERRKNHAYAPEMMSRIDLSDQDRVQRTVFVKAPRAIRYGDVAKVIDGLKGAGATPIGLQIDDLN